MHLFKFHLYFSAQKYKLTPAKKNLSMFSLAQVSAGCCSFKRKERKYLAHPEDNANVSPYHHLQLPRVAAAGSTREGVEQGRRGKGLYPHPDNYPTV